MSSNIQEDVYDDENDDDDVTGVIESDVLKPALQLPSDSATTPLSASPSGNIIMISFKMCHSRLLFIAIFTFQYSAWDHWSRYKGDHADHETTL